MIAEIAAAWLVVSTLAAVAFGKFLRGLDDQARQLHNEERRRREELDELTARRRRRPQR